MENRFESVEHVRDGLKKVHYLSDDGIAGVVFLAQRLGKPILVEGPAGTGKTQLAKSVESRDGDSAGGSRAAIGLPRDKNQKVSA